MKKLSLQRRLTRVLPLKKRATIKLSPTKLYAKSSLGRSKKA